MIDIEKILYDKVKSEISKWNEDDIYAISFFIYSNEANEYKGFKNVSTWAISYNTESDCKGAGPNDEERWNYAFWRQDETPIIDIDEPNECTDALYKWYAEQGIDNIGYEDTENQYDEHYNYIGKGPVGHYELLEIAANIAKKLQREGFIFNHFKNPIPIIIHGLEYAWYDIEATKNANPYGEADDFLKNMSNNEMSLPTSSLLISEADDSVNERRYPASLFIVGMIVNMVLSHFWLFIPGIILLIVGAFVSWCLKAGLVLLGIDVIVSFIEQMQIRRAMLTDTEDEAFSKFQEAISKDGNVFENVKNLVGEVAEEYIDEEEAKRSNFVVDMCDAVCQKCEYGDEMGKLNEYERVFFITQTLEQEVNNGGFSQFFFNSSGDFSNEVVDAFKKIGAFKTAEICKKALAVFNGEVPTDRTERENLLDSLDCDDVLSECDDAFYEYEDNLEELNHEYIMQNRKFFD